MPFPGLRCAIVIAKKKGERRSEIDVTTRPALVLGMRMDPLSVVGALRLCLKDLAGARVDLTWRLAIMGDCR